MTKEELKERNADLIELLTDLRDQINAKLDELEVEDDEDDEDDEDED